MGKNLGLGVMIQMLDRGGREETVTVLKEALGKTITKLDVINNESGEDRLEIELGDYKMYMYDAGQSCCEHRYMECGDKLADFIGAKFTDIEIADGPEKDNSEEWDDVTECQFLRVHTDRGLFTVANYNSHNGYYGGFYVVAKKHGE